MELRKCTGTWYGWWEVVKPSPKVVEYLRRTIPPLYRKFEDGHWYVHDKHAEPVKQLIHSSGATSVVEDDPWAVLHLRPGAPQAIIKAVWKVLASELHPDRGGDPEQFVRVKQAYEKLSKV